jgi:hypothetical protein
VQRVIAKAGSRDILYGEAPFGWRLSPDRSRLVKDEGEQRLLAAVRRMYFGEGVPLRLIVERLRDMGVVNRRGRPFSLSRVFEMVHRHRTMPPEASPKKRR